MCGGIRCPSTTINTTGVVLGASDQKKQEVTVRRIITAREQAEMLAPWRTADWRSDYATRRRELTRQRADEDWAQRSLTPKQQRKQHEKSIKTDPDRKYEWSTRPDKTNPTLETGPEHLTQPTLPGMEKIRGESTRLWRGVPIDLSDPAFHRVWTMTHGQGQPVSDPGLFPGADLRHQDRGGEFDHPELGQAIMDGFRSKGGVGAHHSTDYDTAEEYATGSADGSSLSGEGPHLHLLLDSDWNGKGEDYSRSGSGNFGQEHEITLQHRKAPLDVRQIMVPTSLDNDEWQDVQNGRDHRTTAAYWGF